MLSSFRMQHYSGIVSCGTIGIRSPFIVVKTIYISRNSIFLIESVKNGVISFVFSVFHVKHADIFYMAARV